MSKQAPLDLPETLDIAELAQFLRLAPSSIPATLGKRPDSLPPPLRIPHRRKLLWLRSDVLDWIEARRSGSALATRGALASDSRRKPGRPTKAVQIARAKYLREQMDLIGRLPESEL